MCIFVCTEDIPDVPELDINVSSSNIDISSRRCSTNGNTQEVSADGMIHC